MNPLTNDSAVAVKLRSVSPKTPLSQTIVAYLIGGGIPCAFVGGLFYWFYVTAASEPIVTEEAYNRQVILSDMCKGKALIRHPGDTKAQDAYAEECAEKAWPTFVKPYLQYPDHR
jgi:hypothetical protein